MHSCSRPFSRSVRALIAPPLLAALSLAAPVHAVEVGTVAAVEGSTQIGHGGSWVPATAGSAVERGDELRTGEPGHLRVVFQDDSVLTLGPGSDVLVNEQVFDPAHGHVRSLLQLLAGKVEAVVSEYYHRQGSAYDIKTSTAVAGVRGTDFIVSYDVSAGVTNVVGISGRVQVHSLVAEGGPGVLITPGEETAVADGRLPTPPQRLRDTIFRQELDGLDFVSGGRLDSLTFDNPLLSGARVAQGERVTGVSNAPVAPRAPGSTQPRDAASLLHQSPAVVQSVSGAGGLRIRLF